MDKNDDGSNLAKMILMRIGEVEELLKPLVKSREQLVQDVLDEISVQMHQITLTKKESTRGWWENQDQADRAGEIYYQMRQNIALLIDPNHLKNYTKNSMK